jgi:sugar phosphate isomerase/epimerase
MRYINSVLSLMVTALLSGTTLAAEPPSSAIANPFYAMDTAFQRPGLSSDQQLDLVRELGFAGIAWHEESPDDSRAVAQQCEKRRLKMLAIYCAAQVTAAGDINWSPTMPKLIGALKGHETILWLHVGGPGPAFSDQLSEKPVVQKLRVLADQAAASDLKVAIYPHLGEWTARFGDATKLADLVDRPNFGVSFNLCHCLATGDEKNIPQLLTAAKRRLFIVQINGADAGVSGGQWNRLIQTLDKGTFDVAVLLRKLKELGFAGPIGFQGYGIAGDARSILAPTMTAWRKLSK